MSEMNIAFCINNTYADKAAVVMTSVLENHPDTQVHFYIFSSDLCDDSLLMLQKLQTKYKNFTVQKVNVHKQLFNNLPLTVGYIPIEAYYRYLIADLLPELNKILYLDADLIVDKNISDFYNTDLGNYYLAGAEGLYVTESGHKPNIGLTDNDAYINAGVLLMNLKQMRQNKLGSKLLEATKKLQNKIKYQDQDIINIVCKGKILIVDSIYNFTQHNILREKNKIKAACIIHYTGRKKPWGPEARKVKLAKVWQKYANITNQILFPEQKQNKPVNLFKKILQLLHI
jgi:lipopolysaccharide biosynthesis glycosyltransferase